MNRKIGLITLGALVAASAGAQTARIVTPRALTYSSSDANSARIGVMLGENGLRDTLGVLVSSVVEEGPAAKAGLKEGDRIQAIGGVNLKMARDDAEDAALSGMMTRRLTRELDKLKPGDDVELKVLTASSARTVRVKTVAAGALNTVSARRAEMPMVAQSHEDRAALGLSLGGTNSRRDTLGVFVVGVATEGPAEKAGIVEGDRIARINNVELRVPGTDAGDAELSRARVRRFTQEVAKLKAGDAVTLSVVSGGRQREVRVSAVKASELHSSDGVGFFFGDGSFTMPNLDFNFEPLMRRGGVIEFPRSFPNLPNGVFRFRDGSDDISAEVRAKIESALEKARKSIDTARESALKVRAPIVKRSVIRS